FFPVNAENNEECVIVAEPDDPDRVIPYGVRITDSPPAMIVGSGVTETYQISYYVSPMIPVPNLVWLSGNTSVLTVSQTGLLTAVSEGTTYVTVNITPAIDNFICVDSIMVTVRQLDDGVFRIKNCYSSKYMTLSKAWNYDEVNIFQRSLNMVIGENSFDAQDFRFTYNPTMNAYYIKPINSGNGYYRCLEVSSNNVRINKVDSSQFAQQLFRLVSLGNGQFKIVQVLMPINCVCVHGTGEGIDDDDPNGPGNLTTSDGNIIVSSAILGVTEKMKWTLEYTLRNMEEDYYTGLNLHYPLDNTPFHRTIQSGFCFRWDSYKEHAGLDLSAGTGANVYAAFAGTVFRAQQGQHNEGYYVTIKATSNAYKVYQSNYKLATIYMHLDSYTVQQNDTVAKGQLVGYSGWSGLTSVNSAHFHMTINTDQTCYVNIKRCADPQMFYRNYTLTFE
ncbi:MAG: peptidoglycan DD-metalloendopeptidase family protein, partial [Clostridia bacterium]|nr:peptidoglycan DD-metalloendopeptidase family protein [Clostridia bacterium]